MIHRISGRSRRAGAVLGIALAGLVISGPMTAKASTLPSNQTGMTLICTAAKTAGASCPVIWTGPLPAAQTNPHHITFSSVPPPGVPAHPQVQFNNQVNGDCGSSDIYVSNQGGGTAYVQFGAGSSQGVITDVWYGIQFSDSAGDSFEYDNQYSYNSDGWSDHYYINNIPSGDDVTVTLRGGVEVGNGSSECAFDNPTDTETFWN